MAPGEEDTVEEVVVPEFGWETRPAILPQILKMLVERRKAVRALIKTETNKEKL